VSPFHQPRLFPPAEVVALGGDVVRLPAGSGQDGHLLVAVADHLEHLLEVRLDFLETLLGVGGLGDVHLVDGDNQLLDAHNLGEPEVLFGLRLDAVVGRDHQHCGVSLRGARNHVLDEISVPRGIDDREIGLVGLELLVCYVNRDATLAFLFQVIHHVRQLEATLAALFSFLAILVNKVLLDCTGLQKESAD